MRLIAFALVLLHAALAAASAETATPDSENGRYTFNPVGDSVLRLDTRTGRVSQCNRLDAGWACKAVPDERSALEAEITRLQGEERDAEAGTAGTWAAGTRCAESFRRKAQRAGAEAAKRCRGRQSDVIP